jgi:hypothetical protein
MYLEHMEDYKKTQLQKFFLEEMQRICPQWVQAYESNKLKFALCRSRQPLLGCHERAND